MEQRIVKRYSVAFKQMVVAQIESGELSLAEARRRYSIGGDGYGLERPGAQTEIVRCRRRPSLPAPTARSGAHIRMSDSIGSSPAMQRYRQLRQRFAPEVREGLLFYSGIALAEPFVEALRRAGRHLTREGFIEALAGLDGFDGIATPISYGNNPRYGIRLMYLARSAADGRTEALTDLRSATVDVYEAIARMEGGVLR